MSRMNYNELAIQAIEESDEELAVKVMDDAAKEGITAVDLLKEGFGKGMEILGDQFAEGEVFLPELILASEVMKLVTKRVEEELSASGETLEKKGTIVMGTVADDVHDIGKNICASMLKAAGFDVYDLGKQVPVSEFIEAAKKHNADIIGSSALLTTTMVHQREIEELLKESGLKDKCRTMVGGAPVSEEWAESIGADGYSDDASSCCKQAQALMQG